MDFSMLILLRLHSLGPILLIAYCFGLRSSGETGIVVKWSRRR